MFEFRTGTDISAVTAQRIVPARGVSVLYSFFFFGWEGGKGGRQLLPLAVAAAQRRDICKQGSSTQLL